MQFYIESMSFKGQLVPTGSVSFFTFKNLNGIRKPSLSHSILTLFLTIVFFPLEFAQANITSSA